MRTEGYCTWSVIPSGCLLPRFLPLRATRRRKNDTNGFSATLVKMAILVKMLRSKVMA